MSPLNDGTGKLASYAKSGTPIVWVVDVTAGSIYTGLSEMLGESVNVTDLIG